MSPGFRLEGTLLDPAIGAEVACVAIRSGRIASVARGGATSEGGALWRLPDDLWILPGFVDGHTHVLGVGLSSLRPDLEGSPSRASALDRLAAWLDAHPGSTPVIGEGWDQSLWSDNAPPTRREIDRVAPNRPVALRRVCGHVAVLNSRALALVGAEWDDLDPESGYARESLPLALQRLWPPSREEFDAAVDVGQAEALRRGVTGIHEMAHANSFAAFSRADLAGRLHLRVTHFLGADLAESAIRCGLVPGFGSDRLRFGGLKLFLDGSIGGRSAALRVPYPRPGEAPDGPDAREGSAALESDNRGRLLWEDATLETLLERASGAGVPVCMHAIGDAAIEQAISAVERLSERRVAQAAPGPRIEHAEMLDAALVERAVCAGFLFSMQPNFTARWQMRGALYETTLGWERALALNPYRSVADTGRLLFGSDTMPLDPLLGIRGALTHPDAGQRLTFREALAAYTSASASAAARPFGDGRIVQGAQADFVLLRVPGVRGEAARGAAVRGEGVRGAGVRGEAARAEADPLASLAAALLDDAAEPRVAATWSGGMPRYLEPGFELPAEIRGALAP